LLILSHPLHSPVNLSYHMISVGDDHRVRETCFCDLPEVRIHITNKVLYICFIGELREIMNQIMLIAIGKDIQNVTILRIGNDTVILLASGITLELVQRDHFRKQGKLLVEQIKIAHGSNGRHIKAAADFFCRNELFEREHNLCNEPACNSVVAGKESILLKESFTATAAIAALTKVQEGISGQRNIFNCLHTVVVDAVCSGTTGRTGMCFSGKLQIDMQLVFNIFYICDNYIFLIEKF